VERFYDQPLREKPHLAVLFADKLGGFVVATALFRGLNEKYPGLTLDYFGGERTAELEEACPYIQSRFSLYGRPGALRALPAYLAEREAAAGSYDLAINLDFNPLNAIVAATIDPRYVVGKCMQPDGRKELAWGTTLREEIQSPRTYWAGESFLSRFDEVLDSNYIGEIFCRISYVETDFHRPEVTVADPGVAIPDVLIATGATRSTKLWPFVQWKQFVKLCEGIGLSVGVLGAAPKLQKAAYGSADTDERLLAETGLLDLRGMFTLPQVCGALARARVCVSIDTGPMHMATAVGTPTVAIFGGSPWDLWAPRADHLQLALPNAPCDLCRENRFLNDHCLREQQVCMESISAEDVFERLRVVIRERPDSPRLVV